MWKRPSRPGGNLKRGSAELALCGPESAFMAAVIREAELKGWLVHHETDSRKSAEGFPDLNMVGFGRGVVYMELKVGNNRPTEAQWNWIISARLAGALAFPVQAHCFWDCDRELITRVLNGEYVGYREERE